MSRKDIRPVVKLRSTAGIGYTYVTRKNRRNDPDRLVLRKYDPVIRKQRRAELKTIISAPSTSRDDQRAAQAASSN